MRIQGGITAIAAALLLMPAAVGANSTLRFARFTVTDQHATTKRLASAKNLSLVSVRVNGHELVAGDQLGDNVALMYGEGVVLRFRSAGVRQTVRAISVLGRARVTISYRAISPR